MKHSRVIDRTPLTLSSHLPSCDLFDIGPCQARMNYTLNRMARGFPKVGCALYGMLLAHDSQGSHVHQIVRWPYGRQLQSGWPGPLALHCCRGNPLSSPLPPQEYAFYPRTWCLPTEIDHFKVPSIVTRIRVRAGHLRGAQIKPTPRSP